MSGVWIPPPSHPCAGHGCDGCAVCRAGQCCMSGTMPIGTAGSVASLDQLRAQRAEAKLLGTATPSLRALWERERARRGHEMTAETVALSPGSAGVDWLSFVGDDHAVER